MARKPIRQREGLADPGGLPDCPYAEMYPGSREVGEDEPMSRERDPRDERKDTVSAPRYAGMTALVVALYFMAEWVVPMFSARPGLLLATVLTAPVLGVLVAAWQERSRQRRTQRRTQRLGTALAGIGVAGLVGASLVLAQALTAESAQWMFIGMGGLAAGAAGHAWFRDRQVPTEG